MTKAEKAEYDKRRNQGNRVANAEQNKRWHDANPEYSKKYYEANKKTILKKCKLYREANSTNSAARTEYMKSYYEVNREAITEQAKIYREANKVAIAERTKSYYEANRDAIIERGKLNYETNKESISEQKKLYRKINKEAISMHKKLYLQANRGKHNISEQRREAIKRQLPSTLTLAQWELIKISFDGRCCYCGKEEPLTQEHFIPLSKGGEYTHNNILPACQSCNSSKNTRDFLIWYPKQFFYSKKREQKILKYLNYKNEVQQFSLAF